MAEEVSGLLSAEYKAGLSHMGSGNNNNNSNSSSSNSYIYSYNNSGGFSRRIRSALNEGRIC